MRTPGIVASLLAAMLIGTVSVALGQAPSPLEPAAIDFAALNLSVGEVRVVDSIEIQGFDFKADKGRKLAVLVLKSGHKRSGTVRVSKETFSAAYGKPETIEPALEVDTASDLDLVHWSAKVATTYSQPTTITIALAYSLPADINQFSVRYETSGGPRELTVYLAPF